MSQHGLESLFASSHVVSIEHIYLPYMSDINMESYIINNYNLVTFRFHIHYTYLEIRKLFCFL